MALEQIALFWAKRFTVFVQLFFEYVALQQQSTKTAHKNGDYSNFSVIKEIAMPQALALNGAYNLAFKPFCNFFSAKNAKYN
ncbi:MAG: hypothetical protein E6Q34_04535 [Burkholderiaceae bacterium]|nr:MAG: hypothetical protein E6Q34_04535 [Burkholderiaceae bacterium]